MGQTTLTESLGAIETEIAAGQAERALARCQEIQTRYPRALAVQRVLGEAWLALRKPREALGALDRTLAGNPEDVRACCARAIVHQMHGDAAAALSWYRRACDVRPDDQALRATYLEMATQIGQPAYRPTRVGLARLYLRGGLFTHAIREWELLLAERADLLDAQVGLIETLWRAGRLTQADEWARRTLVNAPSCEKALLISAIIAHDAEQADEAERLLQRVSLLDPDQRMAQALFADRLATGDRGLAVLLWGPDAPEPQPPYSPPTAPAPTTTHRPGAHGGPTLSPPPQGPAAPSTPSASIGAPSAPSVGFGRSPQPSVAPSSPQQPPFPSSAQSVSRVSRTSGPVASGQINDRLIRPLVDSRPAPQASGPIQRPAPTPSRPLGAPLAATEMGASGQPGIASSGAPVAATRTQPLPPYASALPSTFGNIFKETEGMIWGLDDTESMDHPDALTGPLGAVDLDTVNGTGMARPAPDATTGSPASGDLAPSDAFARSTQFVPPMIAQHSAVMDDTEARQAINWVHWLQAQGARTIPSDLPPGASGVAGPTGPLGGRGLPTPSAPTPQQRARPSQPLASPAHPAQTSQPLPPAPQPSSAPPTPPWAQAHPAQPWAQGQAPTSGQGQGLPSGGAPGWPAQPAPPAFTPSLSAPLSAPPPTAPLNAAPRPALTQPAAPPPWALPGRPAPSQQAAPTSPSAPPAMSAPTSAPLTAQGIVTPPELAERRSGPLPPPSPEALRSMFAQLAPAASPRDVQAATLDAAASGAAPLTADSTASAPTAGARSEAQSVADEARANSAPWPAYSAWSTESAASADADAAPTDAAPGDGAPSASAAPTLPAATDLAATSPTDAPSVTTGVTTLEALERGFAASGFEQFSAQPGALAALAAESAPAASPPETPTAPRMARVEASAAAAHTTPPTDDATLAELAELADARARDEPAPAAPPVPAGPDPKDYPARLELARRKRSEGALDDAFVEYTAVLRNAPELVPEVMRDLEDLSADESAHPEAHRLLGDARIRQGDYMSALASLNRATALTQAQEQEDD